MTEANEIKEALEALSASNLLLSQTPLRA